MLFNSHLFILLFLPLALCVTYALSRSSAKAATAALCIASLVYYAMNSPASHLWLLLASAGINYAIGRLLFTKQAPATRKAMFASGLAFNLLVIGYLKYRHFLMAALGYAVPSVPDVLPLGISFFTFTQITFLVDACRRTAGAAPQPLPYLLFVSYFPHLAAGPVLRYSEMMPQFLRAKAHRFSRGNLAIGASLFIIGLAKKCLIADSIAPYADHLFLHASGVAPGFGGAWLGALAHALQIYFDFSGYSDMAIGLSKMLGIRLPANFDAPYKATSLIDFWRRWHISLSRFLRDYIYIPLGGSRCHPLRQCINLLATALLCGLWHGAGWTFIAWGALHGIGLGVNHMWRLSGNRLIPFAGGIVTFVFVLAAGVFYRAQNLPVALTILGSMAGLHTGAALVMPYKTGLLFGLALFIVWALPSSHQLFIGWQAALDRKGQERARWRWRPSLLWALACGVLLAISLAMISGDSPFLYARI